ncbi:hypothetical protein DXG01_008372 [Tephrocybe rancida]|nr:hypothetical protein DXG01_008372 [Tephrocybe rancida]
MDNISGETKIWALIKDQKKWICEFLTLFQPRSLTRSSSDEYSITAKPVILPDAALVLLRENSNVSRSTIPSYADPTTHTAWCSNHCLTYEEKSAVDSAIIEADAHLDDLEAQSLQVQLEMNNLLITFEVLRSRDEAIRRASSDTKKASQNFRALLSPIRMLSQETLVNILRFSALSPRRALDLSRVSAAWRDAALSCPGLWDYSSSPIDMTLEFTKSAVILRSVAPFHHRITHLNLDASKHQINIPHLLSFPGTKTHPLKALLVNCERLESVRRLDSRLSCPKLSRLRIHMHHPRSGASLNLNELRAPALHTVELASYELHEDHPLLHLSEFTSLLSRSFRRIRRLSLSNLDTNPKELFECLCRMVVLEEVIFCGPPELLLNAVIPSLSRASNTNRLAILSSISIISDGEAADGSFVEKNGEVARAFAAVIQSWMSVSSRRQGLRAVTLEMLCWDDEEEEAVCREALQTFTAVIRPWARDSGKSAAGFRLTTGLLNVVKRTLMFFRWVSFL